MKEVKFVMPPASSTLGPVMVYLDADQYIKLPDHPDRKVYGPAWVTITVHQDGGIDTKIEDREDI